MSCELIGVLKYVGRKITKKLSGLCSNSLYFYLFYFMFFKTMTYSPSAFNVNNFLKKFAPCPISVIFLKLIIEYFFQLIVFFFCSLN